MPRKAAKSAPLTRPVQAQSPHPSVSTLTSIAADAGVSLSTVSKVLNGRTDVAPATRDRISQLLRRHGYQPGAVLGFGVVDLLLGTGDCTMSGSAGPWAEALIAGTVQAAAEDNHSVIVTTVSSPGEFDRWLDQAVVRGTHGALSVLTLPTGSELEQLTNAGIPVVVIDPAEEPGDLVRSVGTTNWQGGLSATRHLIELGHRRIAVIAGPTDLWSSRARLDGYRAAMFQAGLPVDARLTRRDSFSVEGGLRQATHLLGLTNRPTAIVACSDEQAFGVLQALHQAGLRAPDDVSVVGFDDVVVARWSAPPLTTVRQPLTAMAATAFRMLRAASSGMAAQAHHIELATTLIVRESTAAPRDQSSHS
jgi:DNA-binding LacI/PurR family transcriptional regulator